MKVLTIKQPWASAILELGKDVENRTWDTKYRGELLIHCSRTFPTTRELFSFAKLINFKCEEPNYMRNNLISYLLQNTKTFKGTHGCILGSVELVDVVADYPSKWAIPNQLQWVLTNPKIFKEPIPVKGQLGLWNYELNGGANEI